MGKHAFVPYWVRWERTFFSYVPERAIPKNNQHTPPPPPPPPRRFFIFFQLLLNTSFHRITLGQSDSAPAGAPSIHWMPEHRFPLDHTGPKWFSTHRRTIHPLGAWTPVSIGSHWARVIQHAPAHHPSTRCLNLLWMNLNLSRAQPARAGPSTISWVSPCH
jgi:hypothetical protein